MKLFSILAISVSALDFKHAFNDTFKDRTIATTFDDFLGHLETRHSDMELRQIDNSERFLVKTSRKLYRLMKRWSGQLRKQRLGCFVPGITVPWDTALNPKKTCQVEQTLPTDVVTATNFFAGSDPESGYPEQCEKFQRRLRDGIYKKYTEYFTEYFSVYGGPPRACNHL